MYGGAGSSVNPPTPNRGLSPHVRGSLSGGSANRSEFGSIPACTGEPLCYRVCICRIGVYPRMYGGAHQLTQKPLPNMGLSPHVRGSQPMRVYGFGLQRSIPACTGEPNCWSLGVLPARVYPRMYGGAMHPKDRALFDEGLSPHVRGSLFACGDYVRMAGSIPACTGEPTPPTNPDIWPRVYPRMYGGAR